jgi:hypothetical protein
MCGDMGNTFGPAGPTRADDRDDGYVFEKPETFLANDGSLATRNDGFAGGCDAWGSAPNPGVFRFGAASRGDNSTKRIVLCNRCCFISRAKRGSDFQSKLASSTNDFTWQLVGRLLA